MSSECPYCHATAETVEEEHEHMVTLHPEIVADRLRSAGCEPPEDIITLTIGAKGHSDVLLAELRNAAIQLGVPLGTALTMMISLGLGLATAEGMITRVTPAGAGLVGASEEEIAKVDAIFRRRGL